ncbi:gluconate kinase [Vulcanimicrobium alpinum]|uniref:Gluconate kinase n=1 Tax=Vulcanimicrobium alpinum TaxID=3016050 RepID=A0AAN1Y0W4_UNVUL|nr:gluconokinase [Vulcanimicrobium alpinum]BDE08152.1 gluconate kinase [Vulcanimicrobium alpinum]
MPNAPDAVVGIDLGTSAVKVLASTTEGRQIAIGSEFYGLEAPHPDFVEQDADVVYRATMRVLERVLADVRLRGSEVVAIGFSSAMHGVLCVDDSGEPISRVITWMDRRAHAIADGWRADGNGSALYARTGAPMHPMLPVAKLRWLAENDPALFAKTRRFVGLKELLVFRWTGEWLVDHGIASATGMLDLRTRDWDPLALQLAQIDAGRLSQPALPSTALRTLRPAIARELHLAERCAVVLASSDGPLANIGVGTSERGDLALTLGTSGAVRILADEPMLDAQGRTFCYCADDRRFVVGGPTSSAGASLDWIFALLLDELPKDQRFARAAALASEIPPGADGLVVQPFFAGERAPYWRSTLRGAFEGLDLAHDRRTILRAAFESVVFGVYSVYEAMRESAGDAQRLLLTGGLTKAPLVRGLLADVFALPAVQPHQQEASAFGAALVAAEAVGLIGDAAQAARAVGYDAPTQPDRTKRDAYRTAYKRFRSLVDAQLAAG